MMVLGIMILVINGAFGLAWATTMVYAKDKPRGFYIAMVVGLAIMIMHMAFVMSALQMIGKKQ